MRKRRNIVMSEGMDPVILRISAMRVFLRLARLLVSGHVLLLPMLTCRAMSVPRDIL
jgi:hypothetical protein